MQFIRWAVKEMPICSVVTLAALASAADKAVDSNFEMAGKNLIVAAALIILVAFVRLREKRENHPA